MKYFLIIISILSLLITGCTRNPSYSEDLTEIESLLQITPDSGYVRICDYPTDRLRTAGDSALYRLLLAEGRYKTFHDDSVDQAMISAADYFISQKDNNRAVRTLFCQGEISSANGQIGKGLVTVTDALELVDTINDCFQAGRLHLLMSELYNSLWDGPQQLYHAKKSVEYFSIADSLSFLTDAKLWYGNTLTQMGEFETGISLLQNVLTDEILRNDTTSICRVLSYLGNGYLWSNDFRSAHDCFTTMERYGKSDMGTRDLILDLWCMVQLNASQDSIEMKCVNLKKISCEEELLPEYYVSKGDYKMAYHQLKNEISKKGITYESFLRDASNFYMESHLRQKMLKEKERLEKANDWVVNLILIIVFLTVIASFIIYEIGRRKKDKENRLLAYVGAISKTADEMRTEKEKLMSENEKIKTEKEKLLSANEEMRTEKEKLMSENRENKKRLERDIIGLSYDLLYPILETFDSLYQVYFSIDRTGKKRSNLLLEMDEKMNYLRTSEVFLKQMENDINNLTGNLLSEVTSSLNKFSIDQRKLLCLLYYNLSNDCICAILGVTPEQLYSRKNRLMTRLGQSHSPRRSELLNHLQKLY